MGGHWENLIMLKRTMLVYGTSAIALAICFAMTVTIGMRLGEMTLWAITWHLVVASFVSGLCWAWALIPTALYLVYAVIVKRIKKETLGVNHF